MAPPARNARGRGKGTDNSQSTSRNSRSTASGSKKAQSKQPLDDSDNELSLSSESELLSDGDDWTPEKESAQITRRSSRNSRSSAVATSSLNVNLDGEEDDSDDDSDFEVPAVVSRKGKGKAASVSQPARKRRVVASVSDTETETATAASMSVKTYPDGLSSSSSAESDDDDVSEVTSSSTKRKRRAPRKPRATKGKKLTRDERIAMYHPEVAGVWDGCDIDGFSRDIDSNLDIKAKLRRDHGKSEQPADLKLHLLPFQLEGVAWLVHQETTEFKGGILADEMGMGKTIQTISLLLSDKPKFTQTLIVCPTVAVLQWRSEILKHTREGALTVTVYHGGSRIDNVADLSKFHVVLTTYSVLETEYRRETKGFRQNGKTVHQKSLLHQVNWHRIVLDEAHNIKDRTCSTARAAFNLKSKYKWSLSGTPLQNRVGELYSLIRFMRVHPYANYFCTQCDCTSTSWDFSDYKNCDHCGHKPMAHFCWWNKEILKPIQKYGSVGEGRIGFIKLGHLLSRIMLRRTKIERAADLGLPPRVVRTRSCMFNDEEMDFYESLYSDSKTKFLAYVNEGTLLNNYAHIFDLLMKMRQAANHPYLVVYGRNRQAADHVDVCGVCQEEAEDPVMAKCRHVFCREDIRLYIASALNGSEHPQCPVCYVPITIDLNQPALVRTEKEVEARAKHRQSVLNRMDIGGWRSSTKIEALLEELARLKQRDCTIKSIVFSQYCNFLDILEWRLLRCGFRCVKLDGRMLPAQRDAVIQAFMTNPTVTVFLVSLKAGGVALNLTEASRVFLCDPWWNPAVEDQAMDRIHRLGQHRPIQVTRIVVENSIESRIIQLQEKKRLLFESTVGMDVNALNRLTEDDLQFLFQL